MRVTNWINVLHDTYVELYNNAEPKADFNKLVENAKTNNRKDAQGRYVIDFLAYEIDKNVMEDIIQSYIKKYKMNKHMASQYSFAIYMGCSPKIKQDG